MALTGAQVKQLRSMAHHLNPAIIIGKSDINDGTVEQTVAYLEKHELVKCSSMAPAFLPARPPKSSPIAAMPRSSRSSAASSRYIASPRARTSRRSSSSKGQRSGESTDIKLASVRAIRTLIFYRSTSTRLSLPSTKRSYRRRVSGSGTPLTCSLR